jgi:hypothetical protein
MVALAEEMSKRYELDELDELEKYKYPHQLN